MTELHNEQEKRKILLRNINHIDKMTNAMIDNGLFDIINAGDRVFADIQEELKIARNHLFLDDFTNSELHTSLALLYYSKAVSSASRSWRFKNIYAGNVWAYFAVLIALSIFILYYFGLGSSANFGYIQSVISAVILGIIGSIIRSIWYLKEQVMERIYRGSMMIYFITSPFLGGAMGLLVYLGLLYESFALHHVFSLSNDSLRFAANKSFNYNAICYFRRL